MPDLKSDPNELEDLFAPHQAKAFVLRHLAPANTATEQAIEAIRADLGLQNRPNTNRALCGFLWACHTLSRRESEHFAFPASKTVYNEDGGGYEAFMSVKLALSKADYIRRVHKGAADYGRAAIYKLLKAPDTTDFEFTEKSTDKVALVKVKRGKNKFGRENDGNLPPLSQKQVIQYFGAERIAQEETRVRRLLEYLGQHPLRIGDTDFRIFTRVFNDTSLERGGRLYGSYSSLPKTMRPTATIDGEPIVQVDIKASYLSVRAGLSGYSFEEGTDPYQLILWVNPDDERSRDFAKRLVSALISFGGDKPSFPQGWKKKYNDIIRPKQTIKDFKGPIHEVFPFLLDHMDGLEVMYRESEMMMAVLETCMEADLPAWPLHDCIFVRQSDTTMAVEFIKNEFSKLFGFRPTVTTKDHNNNSRDI